jgi:hypothetical protein
MNQLLPEIIYSCVSIQFTPCLPFYYIAGTVVDDNFNAQKYIEVIDNIV